MATDDQAPELAAVDDQAAEHQAAEHQAAEHQAPELADRPVIIGRTTLHRRAWFTR
jgi:hypothetical protein